MEAPERSIKWLSTTYVFMGKNKIFPKKSIEKGVLSIVLSISSVAKALIRLWVCARRPVPLFFACNKRRTSRGETHTRSSHIVDGAIQLWQMTTHGYRSTNVADCCPYLLSISKIDSVDIDHYGLGARNPAFVVREQVRHKPATQLQILTSLLKLRVTSGVIILCRLSRKRLTT